MNEPDCGAARVSGAIDPNQLLQRAHRGFVSGALDAARSDLRRVLSGHPDAVQALHLLALVEKKAGNAAAARANFVLALAHAPADPEINSNYANLLAGLGEADAAIGHYAAAVAARPDYLEALLGWALALQGLKRFDEALPLARRATEVSPGSARAWSTLGLLERAREDLDAAAAALDRALALDPHHARALHGKGWVTIAQGDAASAIGYLRRARGLSPDPAIALDEAVAMHEIGEAAAGMELLADAVVRHSGWIDGHRALARMRWQQGDAAFTASFTTALASRSDDAELWTTYLAAEIQAGNLAQALDLSAHARAATGDAPGILLVEAVAASQLGDFARADAAFGCLGEAAGPAAARAMIEHWLRRGDPAHAAAIAERLLASHPADQLGWALLDTAWRLTGDVRHDWLARRPGLVGAIDLDETVIAAAAGALRARHVARRHPVDQSLRGGTQTNGTLFSLRDPAIRALADVIADGVRRYIDALPPHDPGHPLLGPARDRFRFTGSWSVRLMESGFHVAHVHPEGWLSSACYIALPEDLAAQGERAGWLQLGEPPANLNTGLGAFHWIEPKVGRLALFPSYLWHGTLPFAQGERLTVAFDVVPR
jgi:tetratricopeptide (TPR) repeat protein